MEAMSHTGSVLGLLRKALAVSTKLNVQEVRIWAKFEIEGYGDAPVPGYRHFPSQIKVLNPYHGWQPLRFPNDEDGLEWRRRYTEIEIGKPVAEVEAWLASSEGTTVSVPLSPETSHEWGIDYPISRFVSKAALAIIPERVRSNILEWSLELENKGILGEGLSFTAREKAQAPSVTTNNFYAPQYQNNGQVGAMGDSAAAGGLKQTLTRIFRKRKA